MKRFIYNDWKRDVLDVIEDEIECAYSSHRDVDEDTIQDLICQEIDNAVIYYADAWAIAFELADSDWSDMAVEYGEITNICQLAYAALLDKVQEDREMDADALLEYFEQEDDEEESPAPKTNKDGQADMFNYELK